MSTLGSAKLYARVALLRRQILLRQLIRRSVAAAIGAAAFLIASGLATYALYLALVPVLGQVGSVLLIAALYLVGGIVLLLYAMNEPRSPELDALAEMEAAAFETVSGGASSIGDALNAAGRRAEDLGSSLALGVGVLSTLRKLLSSKKA